MNGQHEQHRHVLSAIECNIEAGPNLQKSQLPTNLYFKQRLPEWFQASNEQYAENSGNRAVSTSSPTWAIHGICA
jgi:hypothetical protein